MRFSPAAIALSLTLAMLSSVGSGKRADYQIDPLSLEMQAKGDAAFAEMDGQTAIDYYQTALAVDPRNRAAYIGLARVVRGQGLKGKAIRYYGEALELDPNDMIALTEQGDVLVEKGAIALARKNLARLQMLCRSDCSAVHQLALVIDKSNDKPMLQANMGDVPPLATATTEGQVN